MNFLEALEKSNSARVSHFLSAGIKVNQPLSNEVTPIHIAIQHLSNQESLTVLNSLLGAGADVKVVDKDKYTPLQRLCGKAACPAFLFYGDKERLQLSRKAIQLLIQHGADMNAKDPRGHTPLDLAVQAQNKALAKILIFAGAPIQEHVHALFQFGDHELTDRLMQQVGFNPNSVNLDGRALLDCTDDPDTILSLFKRGGSPLKRDLLDFFILATQKNYHQLLDYLYKNGLATYQRPDGTTPFCCTVDPEIIQRLLSLGGRPTGRNPFFFNRELIFCSGNNREALISSCKLLIEAGVDLKETDEKKRSALHLAIEGYSLDIAETLVDSHCPLNLQDENGQTPLHLLLSRSLTPKNKPLIEKLLAKCVLLDVRNSEGKTALELVPNPFMPGKEIADFKDILSRLLSQYPQGRLPSNSDVLMKIAMLTNWLAMAENLLERGYRFPTEAVDEWVVSSALFHHHVDMIRFYCEKAQSLNVRMKSSGYTPALLAVEHHSPECLKVFLANGADVEAVDKDGNNAFHILAKYWVQDEASSENYCKTFLVLFQKQKELLLRENSLGIPAYKRYFEYYDFAKNWSIIKTLITLPEIPLEDRTQMQILLFAVKNKDDETRDTLLSRSGGHRFYPALADEAISEKNPDLLRALLKRGMPVDQIIYFPGMRMTPLARILQEIEGERSAPNDYYPLILILLEYHPQLSLLENGNFILMHYVIQNGWDTLLELLLAPPYQLPADLAYSQLNGASFIPLQMAIKANSPTCTELLVHSGANPQRILDGTGTTYLHLACETGSVTLVKCFIHQRVPIDAKRKKMDLFFTREETALQIAALKEDTNIADPLVALLLDHGAKVDRLALIFGIKHLSLANLKRMLESLPQEEWLPLNPLHLALQETRADLAAYFLSHPLAKHLLQSRDPQGRYPAHLATKQGCEQLYPQILQASSATPIIDYEGFSTAVHALAHGNLKRLSLNPPDGIHLSEFDAIRANLSTRKEFQLVQNYENHFNLGRYSFKLLSLFTTVQSALAYIEKHQNTDSLQPIHDLCLFHLPSTHKWQRDSWAKLAMDHGKAITEILHLAPKIEEKISIALASLSTILDCAKGIRYTRESENPELARLFSLHHIPEYAFNDVLDNYKPKTSDQLPSLKVQQGNYRLAKLSPQDPRGFVLGAYTHCCQSVGSAGSSCAWHGMTSPYGGFYVVFKTDDKEVNKYRKLNEIALAARSLDHFLQQIDKNQRQKYRATCASLDSLKLYLHSEQQLAEEGEIVAQLWAWISKEGHLVFDSWERLRAADDALCTPLLQQAATAVPQAQVFLGAGGQTPGTLSFPKIQAQQSPVDYYNYRDSTREQYVLKGSSASSPVPTSLQSLVTPHVNLFSGKEQLEFRGYTPQEMEQHLTQLFPLKCAKPISTLDELKRELDQREIFPILLSNGHWSCLIIRDSEACRQANYTYHSNKPKEVLYIDLTGKPLPHEYMELLIANKLLEPFEQPTRSHLIYNTLSQASGPWLLHILKSYKETGIIDMLPRASLQEMLEAALETTPPATKP